MPNQKNVHELAEIQKGLDQSKAVILADYAGLSVAQTTALRSKAEGADSVFMVTKNNLLKIALKNKSAELLDSLKGFLNGPTAALFSKSDPVTGTKALADFAKDNEALKIKAGIMDDKILTVDQIDALAKLPSKDQLLATLLAQLSAPAQSLVRQMNAPIQRLVYALEAIRNK